MKEGPLVFGVKTSPMLGLELQALGMKKPTLSPFLNGVLTQLADNY